MKKSKSPITGLTTLRNFINNKGSEVKNEKGFYKGMGKGDGGESR